jgi:hypothetical protein
LPPWTNRPSPETSISEVTLLPPNPGVGVEIVWQGAGRPCAPW